MSGSADLRTRCASQTPTGLRGLRAELTRWMAVTGLRATAVALLAAVVLTGCSAASGRPLSRRSSPSSRSSRSPPTSSATAGNRARVRDSGSAASHPGRWRPVRLRRGPVRERRPEGDVEAVEQHWKDLGVTTERYQTGGEDPILGVRGRGGR